MVLAVGTWGTAPLTHGIHMGDTSETAKYCEVRLPVKFSKYRFTFTCFFLLLIVGSLFIHYLKKKVKFITTIFVIAPAISAPLSNKNKKKFSREINIKSQIDKQVVIELPG